MLTTPVWPTVTKVEDSPGTESVETHPAYAQIGANRVSGSARLYDSDFDHQHFITVSIHRSEMNRALSRDWPSAREEYIEIALSEAQWATFVSSMNNGYGTPCTLQHLQGKRIPSIADPPHTRKSQFSHEMMGQFRKVQDDLTTLRARIAMGRGGKDSLRLVDGIAQTLTNSLGFVAKQFDEHMENTVEKAKAEISAYATQVAGRALPPAAGPLAIGPQP